MTQRLLILGASARAAAYSAKRAGFEPQAADCFVDQDLALLGPATAIKEYPQDFLTAVADVPPTPWIYTGGLENFPFLVEQIGARHPLLGNSGDTLTKVRDPFLLNRSLRNAGFCSPDIHHEDLLPPTAQNERWLRKPRWSGGGLGIHFWKPKNEAINSLSHAPTDNSPTVNRPASATYLQRYIVGDSIGAVFIGSGQQALLLGATHQLTGCEWSGGCEFQYCGSIGEIVLSASLTHELRSLGQHLVQAFQLNGIFGIDAIVNDERVWTLEVNPRYTASVEILERSKAIHALLLHVQACRGQLLGPIESSYQPRQSAMMFGKAIVYAVRDLEITAAFTEFVKNENQNRAWPAISDIPRPATKIRQGQPVVTVYGEGSHVVNVVHSLQKVTSKVFSFFEKERSLP